MKLAKTHKQRLLVGLVLTLVITIGLSTKFYSGPAHLWVNNSLGGFFYEIFWIHLVFLILPKTKPFNIAIWVFLATCAIEFLQLWHPPFLEIPRENFIGRTILGNSFNWADFPYYFLGSTVGYFVLKGIGKIKSK